MEIRLKESEIRSAVQQYIATQGINLTGKAIDIKFIATRGDAGITAEIDIADIVQVTVQPVAATELKPVLADPPKTKGVSRSIADIASAAQAAVIEPGTGGDPVPAVTEGDEATVATKTTSLFG